MNKKTKDQFNITKTILLCMLSLIIGFIVGVLGYYVYDKSTNDIYKSDIFSRGDLQIHFLQLGNIYTGDCVYIKAGDTDVLIDAGSRNDSATTINSYLSECVTDNKLEYVIATHAHQDHISGFYSTKKVTGVFDKFDTGVIIDFALNNNNSDSPTTVVNKYKAARDNEVKNGASHFTALECFNESKEGAKRVYELSDGIELEILYNYYYDHTQSSGENDYSVCVMINQGDYHYLFTGDLEEDGEDKMVDYYNTLGTPLPHCVLYKAGHHGSKTSSGEKLMSAITPEYVCVCCCCGTSEYTNNNLNQFPTQTFINRVAPYTDKIYVTTIVDNYVESSSWSSQGSVKPMNGNIVVTIKNSVIEVKCSNNDILLKDTDWFKSHRTMPDSWKLAS